jgi:hypothetical protein
VLLVSLALTVTVSIHVVWLSVFVGVNLIQSSITGFCPAALVFKALGLGEEAAFKLQKLIKKSLIFCPHL